jgi:hypothetical protein
MFGYSAKKTARHIEMVLKQDPQESMRVCERMLAWLHVPMTMAEIQRGFQTVDCPICYLETQPRLARQAHVPPFFSVLCLLWNHTPRTEFAGRSPVCQYTWNRERGCATQQNTGALFEDYGSRLMLSHSPHETLSEFEALMAAGPYANGASANGSANGCANAGGNAGGNGGGKPPIYHMKFRIPDLEVPRNSPCPCGSGRKHKNCCGGEFVSVVSQE